MATHFGAKLSTKFSAKNVQGTRKGPAHLKNSHLFNNLGGLP
jgi:hypothetical protein